jgi:uncharacterized protein YgfB (UPF0149 family)
MPENHMLEERSMDFDDYASQLLEQGLLASPSLLHGAICGVLVSGEGVWEADYCMAAISQALDIEIRGELAGSSQRLIAESKRALADENCQFHLFLPDDEDEIAVRVQSLADWCQGFLAAYTLALTETDGEGLGEEVAEILRDVSVIAKVGYQDEDDDEEAESSYFEIGEYLRFAMLNLFQDVAERRASEAR